MMSHRILPAALLLCTLAACGQSPTASDSHARPAGPAYDGGFTMGSGNTAAQSGGGFTIGSGNESEDTGGYGIDSGGSQTESDVAPPTTQPATQSSGYTMGSGN